MNLAVSRTETPQIKSPWRGDFPIFEDQMNGQPLVYLDSGASAQKPAAVIHAVRDVMEHGYANVHRGLYRLSSDITARYEQTRARVAQFIGARHQDEIIFTRGATESINLAAQSWGRKNLNPGDEIIVTEMDHHANIVPWQMAAAEKGVIIKVWRVSGAMGLDLKDLQNLLTDKTKLVAFPHISNVLGTINSAADITARVRAYNPRIKILIDGAQGVVHAPIDVQKIGCDFYAFTGHKLYGPTGVGVLYGRADVLADMPPWQGGGDMIEHVSFTGTRYRAPPHRFEAGTPPILEVIGLGAAIDYIARVGSPNIAAHENALTDQMAAMLADQPGITVYGPTDTIARAGIFSFSADWAHPSDIAMVLDQCGIAVRTGHHCAMPLMERLGVAGTVRASLGLYNDGADIVALARALNKAREILS